MNHWVGIIPLVFGVLCVAFGVEKHSWSGIGIGILNLIAAGAWL